jgi:hypothetical protein
MATENNSVGSQEESVEVGEEDASQFNPIVFLKGKNKKKLETWIELNEKLASRECCFNRTKNRDQKCNCLDILDGGPLYVKSVAHYQHLFHSHSSDEQKRIVIKWFRVNPNAGTRKLFRIPFLISPGENPTDFNELRKRQIFSNAAMDILGRGLRRWNSCVDSHKKGTLPGHKLAGMPSNRKRGFQEAFDKNLEEHFECLKKEAEPIATRYVRETTGETTLRDKDDYLLFLPSYYSVRSCYAKFCLEHCRVSNHNQQTYDQEDPRCKQWRGEKGSSLEHVLLLLEEPTWQSQGKKTNRGYLQLLLQVL